ncbi:MAG: Na+/H+ antiporter NhaC family protein [Emcibacteraceae bacterium]|nr:Na+/H+ antiporter NhaC family protein [Emcibacteraceae bacterium]
MTEILITPDWTSLAPPFVALLIAIITRSIFPALFVGIWTGAWLALGGGINNVALSFVNVFDKNIVDALYNRDRLMVICFTLMIGGFITLLSANGGMRGILNAVKSFTKTPKSGQAAISGLGFIFFFDGIANALLIGKTMQPVVDRLKVSREKLAYIVDSTSAPLASIALASSWIGYEISLIQSVGEGLQNFPENAYSIFLQSIKYSFYPILTVILVWTIALTGKDFGPMLKAEQKARNSEKPSNQSTSSDVENKEKSYVLNATLPIIVLLTTLAMVMWSSGTGSSFQEIMGSADSFKALMWSSFLATMCAGGIALLRRHLSFDEVLSSWIKGVEMTVVSLLVLILSWSLADATQDLRAADFLVSFIGDDLSAVIIPVVVFLVASITAFSTGTSWGTMAILLPLTIPLVWSSALADPSLYYLLPATVAAIINGATFGDHCSPISDTTIISSLASGCDHLEHVRTQAPYATFTALLAIGCIIPVGYGVPWWLCLIIAISVLILFVKYYGKSADDPIVLEN